MTGPITRIILRYIAMFLVAKGIFSDDIGQDIANDEQIFAVAEVVVGAAIAAATEGYYALARKLGWPT